jgi:hypothetical protein
MKKLFLSIALAGFVITSSALAINTVNSTSVEMSSEKGEDDDKKKKKKKKCCSDKKSCDKSEKGLAKAGEKKAEAKSCSKGDEKKACCSKKK